MSSSPTNPPPAASCDSVTEGVARPYALGSFLTKNVVILEWVGCASAVIAALLVALNVDQMLAAYALYLVSSAAWIAVGAAKGLRGMITMQLVLTGITLLGIWRYWT